MQRTRRCDFRRQGVDDQRQAGNVEGDLPMSEGPMNTIGMPGKVLSKNRMLLAKRLANHRASWAV